MQYKVVYDDWFDDLTEEVFNTREEAEKLAKSVHGNLFVIENGKETYLGHYRYDVNSIYSDEDPKTVFYAAC